MISPIDNGNTQASTMTKREYFSALAIQGLCADRHHMDTQGNSHFMACFAAACADELLAILAKPQRAEP